MLHDPVFNKSDKDLATILSSLGSCPKRIKCGVYDCCGFNFENNIQRGFYSTSLETLPENIPNYGVGDSIEQVLSLYESKLESFDRLYAIGFTRVDKANQPPNGGWRWHKWGEYVGTKNPQYEYLYHEPDIDTVYTFSIVELFSGFYL